MTIKILGYMVLQCGSLKVYIVDGNIIKPTYYSQSPFVKNEENDYIKLIEDNLYSMKKYPSYFYLKNDYKLNYIGYCYDINIDDFPNILFEPGASVQSSSTKKYLMFTMGNREPSDSEITRLTLLNATFIN